MILFAGIPSEGPLALAIDSAERLGIPHLVCNQRHAEQLDIELQTGANGIGGTLWLAGAEVPLHRLSGIYARLVETAVLPEARADGRGAPDPSVRRRIVAALALLHELLDVAPCPVLNRPAAMGSNTSKPFQAQIIRRAGFAVPETLITNDPAAMLAFWRRHGRIIYKSVSGVRSIVREWSPSSGPQPHALRALPTQFQALVPGTDVRVHVVGQDCHAAEIVSDAIDYRYAVRDGLTTTMRPLTLPEQVARRCVALSCDLGLGFAGVDLRRTPSGEWFCFEVNPSPGYSYFQEESGLPISDAIVRHLAPETSRAAA
ncbi:ATP-grasp domain-containing protein [Sphingomonas azotifigens]|uniref:ATP-grasp domain-containing protein n=1 Tax=Sphingomonas azotifigens TaxID=330920 RepID=UPI000A01A0A0|nr:hypothetical protein [Sphingomonas azotifigens]